MLADNHIIHIPVIDEKGMLGMVFIGDVVCAVVNSEEDSEEEGDAIRLPIPKGKRFHLGHLESFWYLKCVEKAIKENTRNALLLKVKTYWLGSYG
nr:hypothetical protein [Tanacetum cinerariifolium]